MGLYSECWLGTPDEGFISEGVRVSVDVLALGAVDMGTSDMSITYCFTQYEGDGVMLSASTSSIRQITAEVENLDCAVRLQSQGEQ
jgi:hypothetical protein